MEHADIVAVVGLQLGNEFRHPVVKVQFAFEYVAERKRRRGADLREARDIENRICGRVVGYDVRRAIGQNEPRDRLAEYSGGFSLF